MKMDLDRTYFYNRRQYGPGKGVEVPDEIAPLIQKSGGAREASTQEATASEPKAAAKKKGK